jgi:DNA-binding response OmpR family regulator
MAKELMIVDDSDMIRRLIEMSLASEGYRILQASTGEAAVRLFRERGPQAVILDIAMPGSMDGLEACKLIKQGWGGQTPFVVILSARCNSVDQQSAEEAGADAFLAKPFSPRQLNELIQDHMARSTQPALGDSGPIACH